MSGEYANEMTIRQDTELETITCGGCGILFAAPKYWMDERRKNAGDFHCPNGCNRTYRESEASKLKKQLEEKERALTAQKCETMRVNQLLEHERQEKAKADRKMRRVHKGVCPCCNRSFTNLRRHMETKHPDAKPVV